MPSRPLSSHSWHKVMPDKRLVDDDSLRLEAQALVKAADRAVHSQPVHNCKILLLSDNISIVLCFTCGRPSDFRLLIQCVWRATSGSASDGHQANSTSVTGATESMTTYTILPRVSFTTSVLVMDRRSRFLTHVPLVNPPVAKTKR